jgi:hypothetical protein
MDLGSERRGDERCSGCEDGRLSDRSGHEAPEHRILIPQTASRAEIDPIRKLWMDVTLP